MLEFYCAKSYLHSVALLLALLTLLDLNLAQSNPCRTSKGEPGECILSQRCTFLQEKLDSYGGYYNIPEDLKIYIKKSRCRGNGGGFHICCPTNISATITQIPVQPKSGFEILESLDCGNIQGHRIAFGAEAKLKQFPWMALLKYDDEFQPYKCGGSLITNRYVLTAAHCIETSSVFTLIGIRLGEHDLSDDPDCQKNGRLRLCNGPVEDFGIARKISHPEYTRARLINDVGLIKLDRDVIFKDHIKPICLPLYEKTSEIDSTEPFFITGWGTTEDGTTSDKLLYAVVDLKDNLYCSEVFKRMFVKEHLCAVGRGSEDSCRGDSGGPLFANRLYKNSYKYIQYGVVSFGVKGCGEAERAFPGIYANVIEQIKWITQNIII